MKVKILGTAAAEGWPGIFCQCDSCVKARLNGGKDIRTRSSALIDNKYMIDFPPDTYSHVISNNIDLGSIEQLIITHSHSDHFYPKDLFMRTEVFATLNSTKILHVYGNEGVKEKYEIAMEDAKTEGIIEFSEVFPFMSFKAGDAIVIPLPADHNKKERCYVYIIESDGKKLLYGHDSGYFPEETWKAIKEHHLDIVLLDCTFGPRDRSEGHMGFPCNVRVKDRLINQGSADENTKFVITHFSHNGNFLHNQLLELATPYGFEVAYDGIELEV